jgi:hypothetical protein
MDGKSFPVVGDLMENGGIGSDGGEDDDMMIMIFFLSRARACVWRVLRAGGLFGKRLLFPQALLFRVSSGTVVVFFVSRTFERLRRKRFLSLSLSIIR